MAWLNWIRKLIDGFYSPSRKKIAPLWLLIQPKGSASLFVFFFLFFFVLPKEGSIERGLRAKSISTSNTNHTKSFANSTRWLAPTSGRLNALSTCKIKKKSQESNRDHSCTRNQLHLTRTRTRKAKRIYAICPFHWKIPPRLIDRFIPQKLRTV